MRHCVRLAEVENYSRIRFLIVVKTVEGRIWGNDAIERKLLSRHLYGIYLFGDSCAMTFNYVHGLLMCNQTCIARRV